MRCCREPALIALALAIAACSDGAPGAAGRDAASDGGPGGDGAPPPGGGGDASCERIELAGRVVGIDLPPVCDWTTMGPDYDPAACTGVGIAPLTEIDAGDYHGVARGLYCGSNQRPSAHDDAGRAIAARLVPRDPAGAPDPTDGKLVVLAIGMSNTAQEFGRFIDDHADDPEIDPHVVLVNGALSGQASEAWATTTVPWDNLDGRLAERGVTDAQVAVAWVKLTRLQVVGPCRDASANQERACLGPGEALLHAELVAVLQALKARFANLELVYLSSRIYGGYADGGPSPEPFAFQSGVAVKAVIVDQIAGEPALNWDPSRGPVRAPWLAWGPYLWADGTEAGEPDALRWVRSDFEADGIHPAAAARVKVGDHLQEFLLAEPTARPWYVAE